MTHKNDNLQTAFVSLNEELRRLKRNNLRLRLYLEILCTTPGCNKAQAIRETYRSAEFSESTIHLN
jgi:hypothetical protein